MKTVQAPKKRFVLWLMAGKFEMVKDNDDGHTLTACQKFPVSSRAVFRILSFVGDDSML